ncbi:uncharacterized protein FTJAE_7233 [Fusarium tjaetaba]|uniref:Uncharacterized protein n=1 Tax=Fusarium tjaetaba TaxID=1567544 RepID=A0A8H5RHI1_9HYPO|nr:uncharacterized protein FTJAE_7233 [Fusarium tjaetaba]KAF5633269.1 hypothetical protein FTJAE_7233 [Fusarium tjaetaba]
MADLNKQNSQRSSELIRQGIVQCLALEAECKSLKSSLAESQDYAQRLEVQMAEMREEYQGLMKILAEKDALIEKYSTLMSVTLDRTVQRERQDLRDVEGKVVSALDQLDKEIGRLGLERQGSSGPSQVRAKRPGLTRQGAVVPGTSTSGRSRPRISRENTPRFVRQDAQMYKGEEEEESPGVDSLLQMTCEGTKPRQVN